MTGSTPGPKEVEGQQGNIKATGEGRWGKTEVAWLLLPRPLHFLPLHTTSPQGGRVTVTGKEQDLHVGRESPTPSPNSCPGAPPSCPAAAPSADRGTHRAGPRQARGQPGTGRKGTGRERPRDAPLPSGRYRREASQTPSSSDPRQRAGPPPTSSGPQSPAREPRSIIHSYTLPEIALDKPKSKTSLALHPLTETSLDTHSVCPSSLQLIIKTSYSTTSVFSVVFLEAVTPRYALIPTLVPSSLVQW